MTHKPKQLTYIVSDMSKMIALEWICTYCNPDLLKLSFVFLNSGDSEIEQFVKARQYPFIRIDYQSKKDLPKAIYKTWLFLRKQKSELVHCHLFDANLVGLFAACFTKVKKRIYTRHYATYHHVYFPKAVKYDKWINFMATDIVAISQLVKNVLIEKEHVSASKIHLIPHGFLVDEYAQVAPERIAHFKQKYGIVAGDYVVGVVARYTMLKGIQYIIPAFQQFLLKYPHAKLLIANSHGNDEAYLKSLLYQIPEANRIEVQYERDMGALYKSLDVYVHVPIYDHIEAFGQTYIEALMAKVPSIFTLSGIAQEFIVHESNALVVPFEQTDAIYQALMRLKETPQLAEQLKEKGFDDVVNLFGLDKMIQQLEQLYLKA